MRDLHARLCATGDKRRYEALKYRRARGADEAASKLQSERGLLVPRASFRDFVPRASCLVPLGREKFPRAALKQRSGRADEHALK